MSKLLPIRTIWDLTDPWGTPRHYPPGQHPANYREREHLKRLQALDTDDPQVVEAIALPSRSRRATRASCRYGLRLPA